MSLKAVSKRLKTFIIVSLVLLIDVGCSSAPDDGACAAADGLLYSIAQGDGFTSLTLFDPWSAGKVRSRFVLVPRGSELPERLPEGILIRTPVERAVVYTSVHASAIEQIGAMDAICGVCEPQYLTNEAVAAAVSKGDIANLGLSTSPDVEKIIDMGAELIIATPFENSGYGAAEKLGIPIFEASDYMEAGPLGRASWVKVLGLLFSKEAAADSLYSAAETSYRKLKALAAGAQPRPRVLLERKYGASWGIPQGDSYISQMHSDAGADYVFRNLEGSGISQYPFEKVLDEAGDADLWLFKHNTTGGGFSYADLQNEYAPYAYFDAFKNRRIYVCNTVETPYYDDIALHPDWILKDFIKIYHPEILPDYELKYYKPLSEQ